MRWNETPIDSIRVDAFSSELGVHRIVPILLLKIGINTLDEARAFLDPKLAQLTCPFDITHMDKAVERLRLAMRTNEPILVFGDYDVDGVTSTTVLVSILNAFGIYPRYTVPLRLNEGYGLSRDAIDRALLEGKPSLLIAVDCGTNSVEEIHYLKSLGIDVIVLDHHTSKEALSDQAILVNPHVYDTEDKPWYHLCTAGLVFKFIHALLKQLREENDEQALRIRLKDYMDLVAMGTIADLVPLKGENRILASTGIKLMQETRRMGLCALFEVAGISLGSSIAPFDIAFKLGPRINASGRLADASQPIQMLLSEDWNFCLESAKELDQFNRDRQNIERVITEEAESIVERDYRNAPGIVLFNPEWHSGVVGIVASRISQKYHRPTIILGSEGPMAKGSGRTIPSVNLVEAMTPCANLLSHWGGHPMAVGVSMETQNVNAFRTQFCNSIEHMTGCIMEEPEIMISAWISLAEINSQLLDQLEILAPFGQGNPEPIFGVREALISGNPKPFGKNHFRFQISSTQGNRISGVAWNMGSRIPPAGKPIELALRVSWNNWNGSRFPQVTLLDWRSPR
jgi:single-stranded-DNA-specific exonuclease